MVSNILSTQAVPNSVVFSASKAFVTYFALALGYELEYELIDEEKFNKINAELITKERFVKPEYEFIDEVEKTKRLKWFEKLTQIQEKLC